jgi:hypothetical protein
MTNNTLDNEIQSRISSFLSELSLLVKRSALEAVHGALGEATVSPRRGPGRPRKVSFSATATPSRIATRGVPGKRTSAQIEATASKLLTHIRSKPGQRLEEIGRALKADTAGLKRPIANLLAAKMLTTKGQKRGTKYFVR